QRWFPRSNVDEASASSKRDARSHGLQLRGSVFGEHRHGSLDQAAQHPQRTTAEAAQRCRHRQAVQIAPSEGRHG
ncbi:hypothetical protein CPZ06_10275, partial [Lactobacillus acidophilus]